ncbi:hypothetical protein IAR55_006036 [Kwoniella newhampshirensis]|uniref:Nuclear protein n=1 Tax=Kwoniella newhampshirensis TaxID=1651941 RepID=A0AAW0YRV0_9TREE
MFSLIPVLALLVPVLAQTGSTGSASAVDIEGLQANFEQAQLVPQLLATFDPTATLTVTFGTDTISTGQNLTAAEVASYPNVSVTPSSNTTFEDGTLYTILMVDANPVGTDEATTEQTRHWLVNSVSIATASAAPYAVNYTGSTAITDYAGPGPFAGTGSHRYVIALYEQPSTFTAPANLSTAGTPLGTIFLSSYVSESGLGDLISANYFQVENGVATFTPAATTAVDSTTLAGFASTTASSSATGSASASGSGSASASRSTAGSATSSAAPASSSSSTSAAGKQGVAWGVVVGGMGVVGAVIGAGLGM